jgi:hypothetical protein
MEGVILLSRDSCAMKKGAIIPLGVRHPTQSDRRIAPLSFGTVKKLRILCTGRSVVGWGSDASFARISAALSKRKSAPGGSIPDVFKLVDGSCHCGSHHLHRPISELLLVYSVYSLFLHAFLHSTLS